MKDVIVIGVDHGYAAMKTVHFSFPHWIGRVRT